jgi:hypothetical protein
MDQTEIFDLTFANPIRFHSFPDIIPGDRATHRLVCEEDLSTRKKMTLISLGAAIGLAAASLIGTGAQAAEKPLGNISCMNFKEIHSVSNSKGDVVHEIYGGWQFGAIWPTTSSIHPGYSSAYSVWDVHHWLYPRNESGGRAKGSTGITSASLQCR